MSEEARREFLRTAGAAVIAAAAATATRPAAAAEAGTLPADQFSRLFDDVFRLATDPGEANTTVADVLKRHGVHPVLPPNAQRLIGPLLMRARKSRPFMYTGDCPSCSVCAVCDICSSADALSGAVSAASVTNFF